MIRHAIIGGVCRGNRHVFPWIESHRTETTVGDELVVITTYYTPPKTCECGAVKEDVQVRNG